MMSSQSSDQPGATAHMDYRPSRCRCGAVVLPHHVVCLHCGRRQLLLFEGLEKIHTDHIRGQIERLEKEVEAKPFDYLNQYRLAGAYLLQGKYDIARDLYRRLLEKKSDYSPARLNLGVALACLGEDDAAVAELEEYVRQDVHSPRVERVLRAICSLKNIPYEDVLKKTGVGMRTGGPYAGKRTAIAPSGAFSPAGRRGTMYLPHPEPARRRSWAAIDAFLLFVIIAAIAGWYFFPEQARSMSATALAGLEAPFAFQVVSGEVEGEPVSGEEEERDEGSAATAQEEEEAPVNLSPSTTSYFPLATGNRWVYRSYDARGPASSQRENEGSKEIRVVGLVEPERGVWRVNNNGDIVLYMEKTTGLYAVKGDTWSWSAETCQIPYPPEVGRSVSDRGHIVTVEAEEDIEVPAGLFHCVRLVYSVPGPAAIEWRAWYAQGVGLVRYVGGGRTGTYHVLELRDYHLN